MTASRGLRRTAGDSVRTLDPGCFAFVMATGIVSVALLRDGQRQASAVLLVVALAGLVVLLAASAWRAAAFPAALRADLLAPPRAFAFFTLVAALGVVGVRLALSGQSAITAVLTALAAAAWLALSYLMPAGLAAALPVPRTSTGHGSCGRWARSRWRCWPSRSAARAVRRDHLPGPERSPSPPWPCGPAGPSCTWSSWDWC